MPQVDLKPLETDEDLARRAQMGERDAETALVLRLYPGVQSLAFRLLRQVESAQDATQEAFLRAFSRIDQYDGEHRFSAWLFRILVNLIRDERRRSGRELPAKFPSEDLAEPGPPPAETLIRAEDVHRARSAMEDLPGETQLALHLHFEEGLSGNEIAFALEISPLAARLKICRGIAAIRSRLAEDR